MVYSTFVNSFEFEKESFPGEVKFPHELQFLSRINDGQFQKL